MLNILLIVIVLLLAAFLVIKFVKKRQSEETDEQIEVDDKTYTLDLMRDFIKKRLEA